MYVIEANMEHVFFFLYFEIFFEEKGDIRRRMRESTLGEKCGRGRC